VSIAAVIPARMGSTRLPGKPLRTIAGVPMIVRVLHTAQACSSLNRVIVATDDEEICRTVRAAGGEAWLTSPEHTSGSGRVAEVAAKLADPIIINLQGDEPLLPISTIETVIKFAKKCQELTVVTAMTPIADEAEAGNPNVVKVVVDKRGRALYFSRSPIPYRRDADGSARLNKHIGIYLYDRDFLLKVVEMSPTALENAEKLEQLRVLEYGYPIYVAEVAEGSVAVDTEDDLLRVEKLISRAH
jgi:3-deoxy-manno-octulosonate cytidylyltransferase (CMP-KDO synthetase)